MKKTRKMRAEELLLRLQRGPAFSMLSSTLDNEASEQYKRWANTWVIPTVLDLVSELRREVKA